MCIRDSPDTTCMIQKISYCDFLLEVREPREVFMYIVVELEFTLLSKKHNGKGSKLFRYRSHVKYCLRFDRYVIFKICHPIKKKKKDRVVSNNGYRTTWTILFIP